MASPAQCPWVWANSGDGRGPEGSLVYSTPCGSRRECGHSSVAGTAPRVISTFIWACFIFLSTYRRFDSQYLNTNIIFSTAHSLTLAEPQDPGSNGSFWASVQDPASTTVRGMQPIFDNDCQLKNNRLSKKKWNFLQAKFKDYNSGRAFQVSSQFIPPG